MNEDIQTTFDSFTDREIAEYFRRKMQNAIWSDDFEKQEEAIYFITGIYMLRSRL